jgi:replicative DNA helicase
MSATTHSTTTPFPPPAAPAGRSAPHSIEAEECLLSCCLLDGGDTLARCIEDKLQAAAFFVPANRTVFARLCELYEKRLPLDLQVLGEELKTSGQLDEIGGYPYLVHLTSRIPTTAHAGYFIEKVRELHLLRELIRTATGAVEQCYGFQGGIEQLIDSIEHDLFQITQHVISDSAKEMKVTIKEANAVIAKMLMRSGELTGVASGFTDLDKLTFGFQKQEMIVLAARPSIGKTSLALNFAEHAALPLHPDRVPPVPALVFSLEMSSSQLALRMLCSRARVPMQRLREGFASNEDKDKLGQAARELEKAPLFIDDSGKLTIMELRAKARRLHGRQKLGLIVVDYLQLISPADGNVPREQQVAEASRGLKALAKELDLPVVVLSQLNRSSEKDQRMTRLSDLRESGSIEQDADVVLMLARPKEADEKFQVAADQAELIIAKQRNGPVGELKLTFLRDITRFENFTQ